MLQKSIELLEFRLTQISSIFFIQTVLSVSELHRFGCLRSSRTITAGRDFHPAPEDEP